MCRGCSGRAMRAPTSMHNIDRLAMRYVGDAAPLQIANTKRTAVFHDPCPQGIITMWLNPAHGQPQHRLAALGGNLSRVSQVDFMVAAFGAVRQGAVHVACKPLLV